MVNSATGKTVYTPPPAHDVPIMMAELVEWLNSEKEVHPVLVSGISQFQFVHIHPFLDGNGRTSRLLSTLCLYRAGYDFKRLFTISEYYDRDRPAFYRAIQSVREHGMDMTGWLEYFVEGLTTQLAEVRERGELAIRRDVLGKEHRLSDRQAKALGHILEYGHLTIKDFEGLCPEVNRRSLQRDLKVMLDMGLLISEGATNKLIYRMKENGSTRDNLATQLATNLRLDLRQAQIDRRSRQVPENKYKDAEIGPDWALSAMFFVLKLTF